MAPGGPRATTCCPPANNCSLPLKSEQLRFHLHFTPTSASWLNLVDRWFALLTEKQLRRGVHQSSGELEAAIYRYLDVTNEDPKPFVWTKTADQTYPTWPTFANEL